MDKRSEFADVNGEITPVQKAAVSPLMSGLYHGAGAFETLLAERGRLFRFGHHMERLMGGLTYLGVDRALVPDPIQVKHRIAVLLNANSLDDTSARIRIQVSVAENKGYGHDKVQQIIQIITADDHRHHQGNLDSVNLTLSPVRVVPAACKPSHFKLSNMLHYRDAMRQAKAAGADDALMLTTTGHVAESAVANIFWIKGNTIHTPSGDCDILPGIMRNACIDWIKKNKLHGIELAEERFTLDELRKAESVWLTNSVMGVMPVKTIDDHKFDTDHPLLNDLKEGLQRVKMEESE